MGLLPADVRTIATFLSPNWIKEAAVEYGHGDMVLGAPFAFKEARDQCRQYLRYVRTRDKITTRDLAPARALRACGFVGRIHPVIPADRDRSVELAMWDRPEGIPGFMPKEITDPWAYVPLISRFFDENQDLNLAFLNGRVWNRMTPEVMLNISTEGQTQSIVLDASNMMASDVKRQAVTARKRFKDAQKSELMPVGKQLLAAWMREGMITSPASAMVSIYPVNAIGHAALVPGNGIPWSFVISNAGIAWTADHRLLDGRDTARFVRFIENATK